MRIIKDFDIATSIAYNLLSVMRKPSNTIDTCNRPMLIVWRSNLLLNNGCNYSKANHEVPVHLYLCMTSSFTEKWPDQGMLDIFWHLSLKALTHLATVQFGDANTPHDYCNLWWYCHAVRPLAHLIFNQICCSCFETSRLHSTTTCS